jgi:ceramide glucosyltransferase
MTIGSLAAVYLAIAAIALIHAGLITAQAYEFRRYALSRLKHPTVAAPLGGRAAIIVTCRGLDLGLTENLRSLFEQDYDDYVLILVVDHRDDPAYELIERLCHSYPDRAWRLIVAGAARNCGQKVHNLLSATSALSQDIEYLAFADSDTRTGRSWLRQLVQHLDTPGVAAATAYRWLVPARPTLTNLLLHSLDAGVATVIGPARHHFVWGGSWAIRRETFERFRVAAAWRGTLSDDLVAARALHYAGRIRFEPEALAPTVIDYEWPDLLSFVHRQFALGRRYAPDFWAVATLAAVTQQGVFWIGLALLPSAVVLGGWGAWAVAASIALYAMQVGRAFLRQDAVRQLLPDYTQRLARARTFDLWLAPLAGLLGCWGLISALVSPRIRWRGIHYRVFADGRIAVLDSTIAPVAGAAGEDQAARESSVDGTPAGGTPLPVGNHSYATHPFDAHPFDSHPFDSAPSGGQTSAKLPPGVRLRRARR